MLSSDFVAYIASCERSLARDARDSAGYNGSWDDGGAAIRESLVQYFVMGYEGRLPEEYDRYVEPFTKLQKQRDLANDADYVQYLKLKDKFKDLD